jgi:hypothetical protein
LRNGVSTFALPGHADPILPTHAAAPVPTGAFFRGDFEVAIVKRVVVLQFQQLPVDAGR